MHATEKFLVADTRLYKRLCLSVVPFSIRRLVSLSVADSLNHPLGASVVPLGLVLGAPCSPKTLAWQFPVYLVGLYVLHELIDLATVLYYVCTN